MLDKFEFGCHIVRMASHFRPGTPPFIRVLSAVSDPRTRNHYRIIYPRGSRLTGLLFYGFRLRTRVHFSLL